MEIEDFNEYYPVELVEHFINNGISKEPFFVSWFPYTINKLKMIISRTKSNYWQRTHKFGISVAGSLLESYKIDEE